MNKVPVNAIIPREKLTHYLLKSRPKNDKSGFLAQVGFSQENPDALEAAIRQLITEEEASSDREDVYGVFYVVTGNLHGPSGILPVVTVWLLQRNEGVVRFVTLKPAR